MLQGLKTKFSDKRFSILIFILLAFLFNQVYSWSNASSTPILPRKNTSSEDAVNSLQDELFTSFTASLFASELSSSTLGLYYTLESPDDYGITPGEISLGTFDTDSTQMAEYSDHQLKLLSTYDYSQLNKQNQITYDVLLDSLSLNKESHKYTLFYEPLTPYTGIHAQLPILLFEFPISDRSDIDTYLALLNSVEPYFQSLLDFQVAKSTSGLFMTNDALDKVIQDAQAFIDMENNYLIHGFENRISNIVEISQEEIQSYKQQNTQIINEIVLPSYSKLITSLNTLKDTNTNSLGLCYYENGRNYYNFLLSSNVGSNRSTSEFSNLIKSQIEEDLNNLQDALLADSTTSSTFFNSYSSPEEILNFLNSSMGNLFPVGPDVEVALKDVPSELEPYLSPAFYLVPAIDSTKENIIYLNNAHMEDDLNLYTTLAHEGYPGHLYQATYFLNTNPDPIRSVLNYPGYLEGWATYVEMCSYYMADFDDATISQKNASIMLGLYAYTDIGIHSEGWDLMDTIKFYKTYGITDVDAITRIFELVKSTPTNYLKYYLGYLEILELKKDCINQWQGDFTQIRFHTELLEIGPASFDTIRKHLLD